MSAWQPDEPDPSYVHPMAGTADNDARHRTCGKCGGAKEYCNHVNRPEDDCMTIAEVAKAVGIPRRTVAYHVATGKLASFRRPGVYKNTRNWIKREAVAPYAKALMEARPELMAAWANG